jgi:adenine-specific DNA methylase
MAVAAEGKRQRHYLAPTPEHEAAAEITGTWPMRTDNASRLRGQASNALASSVVLACRPRADHAGATSRKSLLLAEVLDEQKGEFYADTRFCVKWFRQHGFDEGDSGAADNLSRATNTTLTALQRGGIFRAVAGRARLLGPDDLGDSWDPLADSHISDWEVALRLARAVARSGTETAAALMARAGLRRDLDTVKELGYLLYNVCQQKRWTDAGLLFNGLVTSWADIESRSRRAGAPAPAVTQAFGLVGLEDV